MYEDCKIRGPYVNSEERKFVIIVYPDGKTKTTQYCRFLVEKALNRTLHKNEEVHHIDHNHLNDDLSNLEVIDATEHRKMHQYKNTPDVEVVCFECGKKFYLDKEQQRDRRRNKKQGKAGPFCSRKCSGTYGARVQNKHLDKDRIFLSKRNTSGFRGVKKVKNRWKCEIFYAGKNTI